MSQTTTTIIDKNDINMYQAVGTQISIRRNEKTQETPDRIKLMRDIKLYEVIDKIVNQSNALFQARLIDKSAAAILDDDFLPTPDSATTTSVTATLGQLHQWQPSQQDPASA